MKPLFRICCLAVLMLQLTTALSFADDKLVSEAQARAAFLVNIARYVTWPQQYNDSLVIGILGKGALGNEWHGVTSKMFHGRRVKVLKSNELDELSECNLLYIEENNSKKLSRLLLTLRDRPVLTIGDSPEFLLLGGTLNMFVQDNRLAFSINLAQARSVGLEISSNLLKLASEVIK